MPTLENLTEADLKKLFHPVVLDRAQNYINGLTSLARTGDTLTADVAGSGNYHVEIEVLPAGIYPECTCQYGLSRGGFCFHSAATLLAWIQNPRRFAVKKFDPPLAEDLEVVPVAAPPTVRPAQLPVWMGVPLAERHRQELEHLAKGLDYMKLPDLREMAKKRGWAIKGTQKAAVIQQIIEHFVNPLEIQAAYQKLDSEHLRVFRAMAVLGNAPGNSDEVVEKVAGWWAPLKKYKNVGTYINHLVEAGLAVSTGTDYYQQIRIGSAQIPTPIICQLPPPLLESVSSPPDTDNSELQLCPPFDLSRQAAQLLVMLEQNPPPLRPPQPRPVIAGALPQLAGWDYIPAEVAALKKRAKTYRSFILTVPPPQPTLPDPELSRLVPIVGDQTRFEFILALLRQGGLIQPGSPVTVWPEVKINSSPKPKRNSGPP
jgi:hypothetical protein